MRRLMMAEVTRVSDGSGLSKRGGYSGSKPGSSMRPPVQLPASSAGQTSKPSGRPKKG